MVRLTERFSNGQAAVAGCGSNCVHDYKYCDGNENCPTLGAIYEKLAQYEDMEEKGFSFNNSTAELEKAKIEICKMREELHWMRMKMDEERLESDRARAQMEVVQLIFGGRNHG